MRANVLIALLLSCHSFAAWAEIPVTARTALDAYRKALFEVERGAADGIEPVFAALGTVQRTLLSEHHDGQSVLESLSDEDFDDVQRSLPGVVVHRQEVVIVEPDPDYFARLASAHGDMADQVFFKTLGATYQGAWPVYVEQVTDYSGCTLFGSGKLVEIYGLWSGYRARFPARYVGVVQRELNRAGEQMTASTCACGDMSSVRAEMEQFLRAMPGAPIRGEVARRLDDVRTGRSNIRFQCQPG